MKVIFICTGNTCRSPMAKVLFRKLLQERGIDAIEVDSAGLAGCSGDHASDYAVEVMRERGLDLRDHRSRACSAYLLQEGVYGGSPEDYRACADQIEQALPALLRRVILANTAVVPMAAEHVEAIAALERECFSTPWSKQSLAEELTNEAAHFLAAVFDGRVIGYLGILEISGESDVTNIAVAPAYRRLGVANRLLGAAVKAARERQDEWITLEVRESNRAAQELYGRHGFEKIGERKGFYAKPAENAVLMRKLLRDKQDETISH